MSQNVLGVTKAYHETPQSEETICKPKIGSSTFSYEEKTIDARRNKK
jgi:hypothetical protein